MPMKPTSAAKADDQRLRRSHGLDPTSAGAPPDDEAPLIDPGRSLGLRLLALLGAFSFVMLGLSSVLVPLLQQPPPPPLPDQRNRSIA